MATVHNRENHRQLGGAFPSITQRGGHTGSRARKGGIGGANHLSRKEAPGSILFEREKGVKKIKLAFTYL